MIAIAGRNEENKELLAIENIDKNAMAEVIKMSSVIALGSKHNWVISNTDISATQNLRLIGIKKY